MHSYFAVLPILSVLLCTGLGLFTLSRNLRHPANIGFALGLAGLSMVQVGDAVLLLSGNDIDAANWGLQISMTGQALLPVAWMVFSTTFARANHKDMLLQWAPVIAGMSFISLFFIYALYWIGSPGFLMPFSMGGAFWDSPVRIGPVGRYFYVYLILGLVLNLVNLETTFRSSTGSKRWQIKYIIFGTVSILSFFIYLSSQALLFSSVDLQATPATSAIILLSVAMMTLFIAKNRLLDVDIFVSRYVVYNSITVLVVGLYLLTVGIVAYLIRFFEIPLSYFFATFFVFASILSMFIILFSTTIRRRAQLFINRHFYKHKYEFRDKWMETIDKICFTRNVRDVCDTMLEMIRTTMAASSLSLWVMDRRGGGYSRWGDSQSNLLISEDHPFVIKVIAEKTPFPLHQLMDNNAGAELLAIPGEEGILCAPLLSGQELVGFMFLGKDLSGEPYREDDHQLLSAVCTQAAVQIKNIRLAEDLATARELETFHRMSSFVMHDLKNLTNSLSLISQNARYMDRPDFQHDAIKTIDGTVLRMKGLIGRLSSVSVNSELKKEKTDICRLIDKLPENPFDGQSKNISVRKEIGELPVIMADSHAVEMVLVNLFNNACDAIEKEGEILIAASVDNGEVRIAIEDNGKGMSGEFLQSSLFKPFKTTKKGGFGIGLFQCKTIVEGHGGRIDVTSTEGKGTRVEVVLPVS